MRIVCWTQHLTGVGHFVRMRAIAESLGNAHEAYLIDGGRSVPMPGTSKRFISIPLNPIFREDGRLCAEGGAEISCVLAARSRRLSTVIADIAPDVLLIEHYPFSKWELEPEIAAAVESARARNRHVRIIASLRDISPQTKQEDMSPEEYRVRVIDTLNRCFDGLLVHADPNYARLEESFGDLAEVSIPIAYTGLVVADTPDRADATIGNHVVISCGGWGADPAFTNTCIEAFRALQDNEPQWADVLLHVFPGLALSDAAHTALLHATGEARNINVARFSSGFAALLQTAKLSVSRAGYNTCAQILNARVRAVLVPDRRMSDQPRRAALMEANGWATVTCDDPPSKDALIDAMGQAFGRPPPVPSVRLDGAACTRALLEGGFGMRR
jgi:predicted glycosyltransferase